MRQFSEIQNEVQKLAKVIGASQDQLPTYGETRDLGYAHIEVDDLHYHYIYVERGQELERKSTQNFDELLYFIFFDATHNIAINYELSNRIENKDSRRIWFAKQIELMYSLSPEFGSKVEAHISKILKFHPYDDELIKQLNSKTYTQPSHDELIKQINRAKGA